MPSKGNEVVDVEVKLHHRTEKALLVSLDGVELNAVWVPLSQVEVEDKGKGQLVLTLPAWLAENKDLA